MITLWRVDAIHDLGGEVTHFYEDCASAINCERQFRAWGWCADAYAESIERAPPAVLYQLCNQLHPCAPTDSLLALCWIDSREDGEMLFSGETAALRLEELLDEMAEDLGFRMAPAADAPLLTNQGGPS